MFVYLSSNVLGMSTEKYSGKEFFEYKAMGSFGLVELETKLFHRCFFVVPDKRTYNTPKHKQTKA